MDDEIIKKLIKDLDELMLHLPVCLYKHGFSGTPIVFVKKYNALKEIYYKRKAKLKEQDSDSKR